MSNDNYYAMIILGKSWETTGRLGIRVGGHVTGLEIIGLQYVFEPKIPETLLSQVSPCDHFLGKVAFCLLLYIIN